MKLVLDQGLHPATGIGIFISDQIRGWVYRGWCNYEGMFAPAMRTFSELL